MWWVALAPIKACPLYNKIKMSVRLSVRVNEFLRGYFYSGLNENIDNCLSMFWMVIVLHS
jgi:hypothetical protein